MYLKSIFMHECTYVYIQSSLAILHLHKTAAFSVIFVFRYCYFRLTEKDNMCESVTVDARYGNPLHTSSVEIVKLTELITGVPYFWTWLVLKCSLPFQPFRFSSLSATPVGFLFIFYGFDSSFYTLIRTSCLTAFSTAHCRCLYWLINNKTIPTEKTHYSRSKVPTLGQSGIVNDTYIYFTC